MTCRVLIRLALVLIAGIISTQEAAGQNIILGILEDNLGHYAGDPSFRAVRVVFERRGEEWTPFLNDCRNRTCLKTATSHYPIQLNWTITFDGRKVGNVTSRTPTDFAWYGSIDQQEITGKDPVPTVGAKSPELNASLYRPLIANSKPYFKDPDAWKLATLPPTATAVLKQAFRKKFPNLCRSSKADDSKLEPYPYRDEDVKLVKSYRSISGWVVARLHLDAIDCNDVEAGDDIDDPWFVMDAEKSLEYLDSGIWLVDAGDYDNDGKSELVFSINRENEGGYKIYYDDFRKHATFKFNYH
jgi:hypothetical protein